jgi:hypothetical protein
MTANPHELRRWLIMMAQNSGRKALYRVRADRAVADLAIRVSIAWRYAEQNENGFPVPALRRAMETFETAFDAVTAAELVLVTTGMGLREWVFYTADLDGFIDQFKRLLRGKARAAVTIAHCADPTWQYWRQVRQHAKPHGLPSSCMARGSVPRSASRPGW